MELQSAILLLYGVISANEEKLYKQVHEGKENPGYQELCDADTPPFQDASEDYANLCYILLYYSTL